MSKASGCLSNRLCDVHAWNVAYFVTSVGVEDSTLGAILTHACHNPLAKTHLDDFQIQTGYVLKLKSHTWVELHLISFGHS